MYSCCDSRSRQYRKKRGWSTHRRSSCGNQELLKTGKKVETYTGLPCLMTEPLSLVPEFRNRKPKLEKMGVVGCGQHVHCWSVPRPEDRVTISGWRLHSVIIGCVRTKGYSTDLLDPTQVESKNTIVKSNGLSRVLMLNLWIFSLEKNKSETLA